MSFYIVKAKNKCKDYNKPAVVQLISYLKIIKIVIHLGADTSNLFICSI